MPIVDADLILYKSQTVSDSGGNGGRMSANVITSGALKNVFPSVGESERTAGSTKRRKVFFKNENGDGLGFQEAKIYLERYTPGDDRIHFHIGSQTDTQADITGSEKTYGCGKLDANVSIGNTSVTVEVEDGPTHPFDDGDKIRITNDSDEEYVMVSTVGSVVGNVVTLNLATPLVFGYSASNSRVMNVYDVPADVDATHTVPVVTSAGDGDFDHDPYFLDNNEGAIQQNWTLTFINATTFNISGDTVGAQGSGSTGGGAAPVNSDFGVPFFTLQAAGFSGTWQAGDTITFTTVPSSVAVWLTRVVPAGAAALTVNEAEIALDGETAA